MQRLTPEELKQLIISVTLLPERLDIPALVRLSLSGRVEKKRAVAPCKRGIGDGKQELLVELESSRTYLLQLPHALQPLAKATSVTTG